MADDGAVDLHHGRADARHRCRQPNTRSTRSSTGSTGDGGGVIFISSELEELLAISDRILVMSQGEIVAEFPRAAFDRERILPPPSESTGSRHEPDRARPGDRLPAEARDGDHLHRRLRLFRRRAPNFFSTENVVNIVKQASFIGVIAVGMTFVLLTAASTSRSARTCTCRR